MEDTHRSLGFLRSLGVAGGGVRIIFEEILAVPEQTRISIGRDRWRHEARNVNDGLAFEVAKPTLPEN